MKNANLQCIIVIKINVVFKIISCCYYFFWQVLHMWQKKILKERCSEWVIRSSLYWITAYTRWKLDEDELNWVITFDVFTEESQFEFERLLNDYKIRESLQRQTGQVRASIIDNVLNSIDKRLAE
ncbi:His-Xaa-Ser system protein HxsD [Serratia marcescens]